MSRNTPQDFALCLQNTGYQASLEVRKLYPIIPNPDAESNGLIRVVDESGAEIQRALRRAS